MGRPGLLFLVVALIGLGGVAFSAEAKPTVIYLSADDCTSCRGWERSDLPSFERSVQRKKVEWREVRVKTLRRINVKSEWPADLEWLRVQVPASATPRFYLIEGERLIAKGDGVSGWSTAILPAIQKLGG